MRTTNKASGWELVFLLPESLLIEIILLKICTKVDSYSSAGTELAGLGCRLCVIADLLPKRYLFRNNNRHIIYAMLIVEIKMRNSRVE